MVSSCTTVMYPEKESDMSFSSEVKEELAKHISPARHCQIAELAALMNFSGQYGRSAEGDFMIGFQTENEAVVRKGFTLLKKTFNIRIDVSIRQGIGNHKNRTCTVAVTHHEDAMRVLQAVKLIDPYGEIEENLSLAYLRTAKNQHAFFARVGKKDRAFFREQLAVLNMGLEDRMSQPVGLLSGGQRQALTLLMAALQKPKLLLLDEHTAALDPRTAAKVLELSDKIVEENHLTTMMITHNMRDAIAHGNRLIMMDAGHVVLDISGEEKKKLTVSDLLTLFSKASGTEANDDKLLLS